jgi:DNA-binding NarL/FixJ family response regulator
MAAGGISLASGVFEHMVRDGGGASCVADFRRNLLAALGCLLGADSAAMMDPPWIDDCPCRARERTAGFGSSAAYAKPFLEHRGRFTRSAGKLLRAIRAGGAVIDADVYSSRARRELAIYREIFLPQRASSILAAAVCGLDNVIAMVVFKRHGSVSAFGVREASALEAALPAIGLADLGFRCGLEARRPGLIVVQRLTRREAEVASLASRGLRNTEIAALLGTSVETTRKQLKSVFAKADVSNRTELAMLWATSA